MEWRGAAVSKLHELKTHIDPFEATRRGDKPYELRKNDRDFQVGDTLLLREWDNYNWNKKPDADRYTGRWVLAKVTYMTKGGDWGLPLDLCVLGISIEGQG
jgi:hypothetical protein